jgi:ATP synthase protein I
MKGVVVLPCTIPVTIMRGLNTGPSGIFEYDATHRRQADGSGVFSAGGKRGMDGKARERSGASPVNPMLAILLAQLVSSVALAAVFWGIGGSVAGYSALLGGLTCVIPNTFLALRLVVPRRDPGAGALVRAAYIGELGKLALTVLMFGMVFTLVRPMSAAALFSGFIVAQLVTFSGFLMRDGERNSETKQRLKNGE